MSHESGARFVKIAGLSFRVPSDGGDPELRGSAGILYHVPPDRLYGVVGAHRAGLARSLGLRVEERFNEAHVHGTLSDVGKLAQVVGLRPPQRLSPEAWARRKAGIEAARNKKRRPPFFFG